MQHTTHHTMQITINGVLYNSPVIVTTASQNGINYNQRQFNANGVAIYTGNTSTITHTLNVSALNGILYDISKNLENAMKANCDVYGVIASATKRAIHALDIVLSVLKQSIKHNQLVYNAFYGILEYRQKLELQSQFMQFCVEDEKTIRNEYKNICDAVSVHNNDVLVLRLWNAKKHRQHIKTATRNVEKMVHDNNQRHANNMQVVHSVMLSMRYYAR